ncbi:formate dehydrogenase accessory sulfurtransferase FdhD [Flavihumibacter stibioxidans]|uniref:Sulfur carrier protein FdhD n=1 Tax=Flavihumibacter stibioxidans TaxID=1834163 RepID=A0ABR7MBN2_9BACT|nr:formate dehydrogenase accessory sulfurtransferase FdhD [Flavihumibacter stibioxidans]MBC6492145.1 formate dehydrogenase family accessory protein FdhD [Flavihumibacter stibioxidans]
MNEPASIKTAPEASRQVGIIRVRPHGTQELTDQLAMEEPLQISLEYSTAGGQITKNIAVTLRTPGADEELALGFLFSEGIIDGPSAIERVTGGTDRNSIKIRLKQDIIPELVGATRNFYLGSGCGVCGKAGIDSLRSLAGPVTSEMNWVLPSGILYGLPDRLEEKQALFGTTGGLHAAAIFDANGNLEEIREDIGRHNALDKLIGATLLKGGLPLERKLLLLSGRLGFELLQKAALAGIQMVAGVGAPSSLALEIAQEYDITLIGFLRRDRFNIYHGAKRIQY